MCGFWTATESCKAAGLSPAPQPDVPGGGLALGALGAAWHTARCVHRVTSGTRAAGGPFAGQREVAAASWAGMLQSACPGGSRATWSQAAGTVLGVAGDRARTGAGWLRLRVCGLSGSCRFQDAPGTAPLRALQPYRSVPGPGARGTSRASSPSPGEGVLASGRNSLLFLYLFPNLFPQEFRACLLSGKHSQGGHLGRRGPGATTPPGLLPALGSSCLVFQGKLWLWGLSSRVPSGEGHWRGAGCWHGGPSRAPPGGTSSTGTGHASRPPGT